MNDIDFEEQQLLQALNHQHHHQQHHQHQHLTLPGPNDNYNYNHRHQNQRYHSPYQRQYFEDDHHRHQSRYESTYPNKGSSSSKNITSTVSMSTEKEILDDFTLFDVDPAPEIVEAESIDLDEAAMTESSRSTIQTAEKFPEAPTSQVPRSITMDTPRKATKSQKFKQQQERRAMRITPQETTNSKKRSNSTVPYKVASPSNEDILCGQSRVCASHPGNRRFQHILEDFAHKYDIATSKQEKMTMTKSVVSIIHESGGRFLKYKEGMWEEISTVAARDKVSHALRTKVASWKRQQQQLNADPLAPHQPNRPRNRSKSPKHFSQARKRSSFNNNNSNSNNNNPDLVPLSLNANDAEVMNGLIESQQQIFAKLTTPPSTPTSSNRSHHHVRHSYGGASNFTLNHPSQHAPRRSSSRF